ncbi:MAG TPA: MoxR family ATPase, partial [Alphaproteobacteria bacterium]|nr:MoxR family ATPase [Alphaproteobacteria bacterium]
SPRTQSALLQAMQERQVSVAGRNRVLPHPFHVIATQNPIEQEGIYPLPEAQLDRFLMQINIDYPALDDEWKMLIETTGSTEKIATAVLTAEELLAAQQLVRNVPVGESVVEAILELVRSGRPQTSNIALVTENVSWGPGPRAGQALMLATRARALLDGRISPSIDDVVALAPAVLRHRMNISFAARAEGLTLDQVIAKMCAPFA